MSRIGVLDYGIGNHASILSSLKRIGHFGVITAATDDLDACDVLILPGVGAFPDAMANLCRSGLSDYVRHSHDKGRTLIGICLGMQMLASSSSEGAPNGIPTLGLDLIPGDVRPFESRTTHTGWNEVTVERGEEKQLLKVLPAEMYFNHAYVFDTAPDHVAATTTFGNEKFPAIVHSGNTVGCQFHPEKSQADGLAFLKEVIDYFS